MSNLVKALKAAQPDRPVENPYATAFAAEVLEADGKYDEAALVRLEAGTTLETSNDPLDILLAREERASQRDTLIRVVDILDAPAND